MLVTELYCRKCAIARIKYTLKSITYFSEQETVFYGVFFVCCRDLDARAKSERYRALFRLPKDEKLDGHTDCTLWTPFNKMHILGQMFVSTNYICFTSKEENLCSLIIPLREVNTCGLVGQRNQVILYWKLYHSFFFFQCWRKPLFISLISCERTILMCSV